jgi:hypothetical protein
MANATDTAPSASRNPSGSSVTDIQGSMSANASAPPPDATRVPTNCSAGHAATEPDRGAGRRDREGVDRRHPDHPATGESDGAQLRGFESTSAAHRRDPGPEADETEERARPDRDRRRRDDLSAEGCRHHPLSEAHRVDSSVLATRRRRDDTRAIREPQFVDEGSVRGGFHEPMRERAAVDHDGRRRSGGRGDPCFEGAEIGGGRRPRHGSRLARHEECDGGSADEATERPPVDHIEIVSEGRRQHGVDERVRVASRRRRT